MFTADRCTLMNVGEIAALIWFVSAFLSYVLRVYDLSAAARGFTNKRFYILTGNVKRLDTISATVLVGKLRGIRKSALRVSLGGPVGLFVVIHNADFLPMWRLFRRDGLRPLLFNPIHTEE